MTFVKTACSCLLCKTEYFVSNLSAHYDGNKCKTARDVITVKAHCKQCGIGFGKKQKFCSSNCSATFNNTNRVRSQASKDKVSATLSAKYEAGDLSMPRTVKHGKFVQTQSICQLCSKAFMAPGKRIFCSAICAGKATTIYNPTGKYVMSIKECLICKQKYSGTKSRQFCSVACKSINQLQIAPNKICLTCNGAFKSKSTKKYCSKSCAYIASSARQSAWLKANRKHILGRSQPSYMERTFKEWLIERGIAQGINGFLTEVQFKNNTSNKNGWADFVFPRLKVIIELDGSQHRKTIVADMVRDAYLLSRGWYVLRVSHAEYRKKTKLGLIETILDLL